VTFFYPDSKEKNLEGSLYVLMILINFTKFLTIASANYTLGLVIGQALVIGQVDVFLPYFALKF
jgi:hypothetical protein